MSNKLPYIPKLAKLTRWFLGKAIRIAVESGFKQFIDFASALPTANHIHLIAHEGSQQPPAEQVAWGASKRG